MLYNMLLYYGIIQPNEKYNTVYTVNKYDKL